MTTKLSTETLGAIIVSGLVVVVICLAIMWSTVDRSQHPEWMPVADAPNTVTRMDGDEVVYRMTDLRIECRYQTQQWSAPKCEEYTQ